MVTSSQVLAHNYAHDVYCFNAWSIYDSSSCLTRLPSAFDYSIALDVLIIRKFNTCFLYWLNFVPRRINDQIIANILSACQGAGASKTRIVYQANMNFRTINPYLDLLIEKALIDVVQGSPVICKTTRRGEKALESLREIKAICLIAGVVGAFIFLFD
jgi:predicted transcriptional regulator